MQDYADYHNQFYHQAASDDHVIPNLDHQAVNQNNPDAMYWCYQDDYPQTSFYNNENRSEWYGNYDNFWHSPSFARTMDPNHTERMNDGSQYFDQRAKNYSSGSRAHFQESYESQDYLGKSSSPVQPAYFSTDNREM